ncbi:hypothetical protein PHMEG_00038399, partial [Phytophthora megakarya]
MTDLQVAHDQLAELRDLAESDLNEVDILLTHLASRIRESQATRMPKHERSTPRSPPQLPPHKAPRSDRPVSPPPNRDQPEIEGPEDQEHQDQPEIEGPDGQEQQDQPDIEGPDDQEHQDQPEFEGPDDQELEEKPEIPSGGGSSPSRDSSSFTSQVSWRKPWWWFSGGGSPIQLHPPLFPSEACIPHYSALKLFMAAEFHPWDPTIVGTVPIIAMIQATLKKRMPIPANFLFPHRVPPVRAPIPLVGYRSELITGANVLALMANEPWRTLGQRRLIPLTFDHNLHRRAETPLWRIAVSYAALEEDHMIAYWESTHYLEITSVMTDVDSDLFTYLQDRAQWADIDILLDPYFLHLPTKQDRVRWYPGSVSRAANLTQPIANLPEPTDLITA